MVASVYRHVQHHALIKDTSQISKIISILYHSYCENLTWYRKGISTMYVVAAFLGGFNRNRKKVNILNNFSYNYKVSNYIAFVEYTTIYLKSIRCLSYTSAE